jgi:hypothetical protein
MVQLGVLGCGFGRIDDSSVQLITALATFGVQVEFNRGADESGFGVKQNLAEEHPRPCSAISNGNTKQRTR